MMYSFPTKGRRPRARSKKAEPQPRVFAAPGMLDGKVVTVTREDGESDARYQSRCELVDILIDRAKQG